MNKLKVREVWISINNPDDVDIVAWFKGKVVFIKDLRETVEELKKDIINLKEKSIMINNVYATCDDIINLIDSKFKNIVKEDDKNGEK